MLICLFHVVSCPVISHATDGPPKIGSLDHLQQLSVAMDGPPGPSMASIDGPLDL